MGVSLDKLGDAEALQEIFRQATRDFGRLGRPIHKNNSAMDFDPEDVRRLSNDLPDEYVRRLAAGLGKMK